ncbi:hypothetical protein ACFX15_035027 [Malus domestica]
MRYCYCLRGQLGSRYLGMSSRLSTDPESQDPSSVVPLSLVHLTTICSFRRSVSTNHSPANYSNCYSQQSSDHSVDCFRDPGSIRKLVCPLHTTCKQ